MIIKRSKDRSWNLCEKNASPGSLWAEDKTLDGVDLTGYCVHTNWNPEKVYIVS